MFYRYWAMIRLIFYIADIDFGFYANFSLTLAVKVNGCKMGEICDFKNLPKHILNYFNLFP